MKGSKLLAILLIFAVAYISNKSCKFDRKIKHDEEDSSVTKSVSAFHSIAVDGNVNMTIKQGEQSPLLIEANSKDMDLLVLDVQDSVLHISSKDGVYTSTISIEATIPTICSIVINGSGDIELQDEFTGDSLEIVINGSGELQSNWSGNHLNAMIIGSGEIHLEGKTLTANYEVTGSGTIEAFKMKGNQVKVSISGSGDCELWAVEHLNASISGSGDVLYVGKPQVEKHISGSGEVERDH